MQVQEGLLVSIFYRITTDEGEIVDQTLTDEPVVYRHGSGSLPRAIEERLEGLRPRETVRFTLPARACFGERDPGRRRWLSLDRWEGDQTPRVGSLAKFEGEMGRQPTWIEEIASEKIVVDDNDPLAGQTLHFHIGVARVVKR
ncbi:MAG: FKBP-type peptidyl-prolyl cis-trans isomerase [Bradymonadales bacterium]|nr:FKBP-type peptidyl-prolyl cis-trans isomerase [Bradymonadales bacterium]